MQCSAVQCSAVQCSAVQCSAVLCSFMTALKVQCSEMWQDGALKMQCSVVQCSEVNREINMMMIGKVNTVGEASSYTSIGWNYRNWQQFEKTSQTQNTLY